MDLTKYITTNRVAFLDKLHRIANALQVKYTWLLIVMYSESRLNNKAYNAQSGAAGLIQFMPATATALGTSTQALLSMSNIQQLDYVYKYYKQLAGKYKNVYDLYLYTFYPYAVGKPNSFVIGSEVSKQYAREVARVNQGFDLNRDGLITVGEFKIYIKNKYGNLLGKESTNEVKNNLIWLIPIAVYYML